MTQSTVIEISTILTTIALIKRWYDRIAKIITPLIVECEKLAQDGVISQDDRKIIVLKAIGLLEQEKVIRLNLITRIIVSKIVDRIAQKLPDFTINQKANGIIQRVVK